MRKKNKLFGFSFSKSEEDLNNNSNKAKAVKYLPNGPVVPFQGGAPQQSYGMGSEEPGQEQRGRGREKETGEGVVEGTESMELEPAWSRTGGEGGEGEKRREREWGYGERERTHKNEKKKKPMPKPTGISYNPRKTIMPKPFLPESSY